MKVGVVIVSFNAAQAVRATLASVRQARNDVAYELVLVDNASSAPERSLIEGAFDRHASLAGVTWRFMPQDANLGFAGGNNIGMRAFLDQADITHLCLLNGDVIVTDHWLDRLVEKGVDFVSAVTNQADSEQCVPVDYVLSLDDCLDEDGEHLRADARGVVQRFADWRHVTWKGALVETEVTFFVVLLSTSVVNRIGLLDERFFPGGFEDNDYCLRARAMKIPIYLARDVFIHHWGSASFGQLPHEYFGERSRRNIAYLEQKHGISLERHPEGPLTSYASDMILGLTADAAGLADYHGLYRRQLDPLIRLYASEFRGIYRAVESRPGPVPPSLDRHMTSAHARPDIEGAWSGLSERMVQLLRSQRPDAAQIQAISADLKALIESVHDVATCNLAMHGYLQETSPQADEPGMASQDGDAPQPGRLNRWVWALSKGARFLWNFRGIVFFGGYPYPERQSDGYFQRIQIIDSLFLDRWRVYVESTELVGRDRWFDRPADRVLVLRILGGRKRRLLVTALAVLAALRSGRVYFHSVLRMHDHRLGRLMHLPWLRKVIDVHGVVPEEFRFHNDFYSASLYDKEERLAVRNCDLAIVVSEAMHGYLRQKYRDDLRARVVAFPMFPSLATDVGPRPYVARPVVVYAGGLHRWQQVPKMIDAISRTRDLCEHRFYCPEPDVVREMLPPEIRGEVIVARKSHQDLMELYAECHYGFLLREDVVVNHVACPTKAVEYLAKGIVPIIDCENIGDFKALGMRFVRLSDFVQGGLPGEAERDAMARDNLAVYERLRQVRDTGAREIHAALSDRPGPGIGARAKRVLRRLLPADTRRGQVARRLARGLFGRSPVTSKPSPDALTRKEAFDWTQLPSSCDILMQVDNFEAGGLENVVLDLNQTLEQAGYRVAMLVLGNVGAAADRARQAGTAVIVMDKDSDRYAELLKRLSPKLALTHYSTFGAAACNAVAIPFVQVIHNAYMWLSDTELAALRASARDTTGFIAVSEYARRYSIERLGLEADKCVVIPNGIDTGAFAHLDRRALRREKRQELGIADGDYVFLSVGSINHQKNHLAAIRAFAAALDQMPEARLVILGPVYEPVLQEEIESFINRKQLAQRVLYAGAAPAAYPYYAMSDAFLSAAHFEGGQLTLLEAISANLSVVTTDIGFAHHFRGMPGFEIVAPAFDIVDYRGEIWEMASPPDLIERLAQALRRTYRGRRRPDLSADAIGSLDKRNTNTCYLDLVSALLHDVSWEDIRCRLSWPESIRSGTVQTVDSAKTR